MVHETGEIVEEVGGDEVVGGLGGESICIVVGCVGQEGGYTRRWIMSGWAAVCELRGNAR